jgi:hypothetical protein
MSSHQKMHTIAMTETHTGIRTLRGIITSNTEISIQPSAALGI